MTPDEILAAIKAELDDICSDSCADAAKAVVRAVLDLHKPCADGFSGGLGCEHCFDREYGHDDWPCPTVQAVAKALGIGGDG